MAEHDESTVKPDRAQARAGARGSQSNPDADKPPAEVRYSVEDLMENPRLIGTTGRAIAGAMYGADRKTFTLDEAAKRVRDFLGRQEEQA